MKAQNAQAFSRFHINTALHSPSTQAIVPCPQSMVPSLHSWLHNLPLQIGALSTLTASEG
jgi:hypothetical protein